jgi:hypothetical protein
MKNLHIFKIKYFGPTNFKGSRIRITSERFEQSIIISWDYSQNGSVQIAANHLQKLGFNIIGQSEGKTENYLISDTFNPLKK